MALTQAEKDRIVEEETLRLDARMKAQEAMAAKGQSCGRCGHTPGCRGCRVWGWIFVVLAVMAVCHFFSRGYGYGCCSMDRGGRGMMGGMGQRMDMPPDGEHAPPPPKAMPQDGHNKK